EQWVEPPPVPLRPNVPAPLARRRDDLENDLPDDEDERARDVEPVREEPAIPRIPLLLRTHAARRQEHVVRLAREQVPPTRSPVTQEAVARAPPLDLRAVVGVR